MLPIATAALIAFSATVEAAITKYDYGGRESYKHEDYDSYDLHGAYGSEYMRWYDHGHEAYKTEDYHYEPFYESHFADRDYRELHHNSYDEDHNGGDAYPEVPSYVYELTRKSSPAKRYQRSVQDEMGVREDQVLVPFGGKIGKKLGKILHNPVLKKVSKKVKRSLRDGQFRRRLAVAKATFTEQGVSGTIQFEQRDPSHAAWTCIKLSGLGGQAGMFHVHEFAVKDNNCSSTGGHFNPFNVDASRSPSAGTGSHAMHEVGDLSGKHGSLEGKDEVDDCFRDTNISLFGKHSIVNRSVVIHKNPGGDRWVCADIFLVR